MQGCNPQYLCCSIPSEQESEELNENHFPKGMLPVLTTIVKTYNNKLREQEVTFQEQVHALSDEIMLLQRQIHYPARHLPPGLQMPLLMIKKPSI